MKKTLQFCTFFLFLFLIFSCAKKAKPTPRVLVFTKTAGYRHASIPDGIAAIQKLGAENGFLVDTTENANNFQEDTLQKYAAVVFLSTTGDVLNHRQQADFERYIQSSGGFVGVHAATDTEENWEWYNKLVGAQFSNHPAIQEADLKVTNHKHLSTKHLADSWHRKDEWYNFKNYNTDVKTLLYIDEKSYQGGGMGDNHPMAWYHNVEGGRAFYTALGHTSESYSEPDFLKHLLGGIQFAIGTNSRSLKNATSLRVPEDDRFTKTLLADGLNEPTEMAVLPNGDVLFLERRGNIKLYSATTKKVTLAGNFEVYFKTNIDNVNAEEGMLGITIDPNFKQNKWVYIFYSPADTSVNRLSRFQFIDNQIVRASEQKILEFYSQREICCHTGGSLAFGPDGLLYLSTGDNATPFDEIGQKYVNSGFAPINDAPGHEQYDAGRTSGNTNDLRGKILRLKINENGTYSIPEGNLFPVGTPKTRPEIYVMGCRNPYRLSIDAQKNILFWGEVGPDSAKDSFDTRGPRGYDEVNMAAKAGNYGWPFVIANNYPYYKYDYLTGQKGEKIDPKKPTNTSRNNTGLQELPPANPAYVWYPYAKSKEFPLLGSGSRNAMAGPIYYAKNYPKETRLPDYYNGKLLIYDWMRAWIFAVTMDEKGNYKTMEPFAPNIKMACPIDMEMGPDGKIYVLDYGKGWFTSNAETSLYTIEFNHKNLPPRPVELLADKTGGKPPFNVHFSLYGGNDPEGKALTYRWNFGYGNYKETKTPKIDYSFPVEGIFNVSVEVIDNQGLITKSNSIAINAGNDVPRVNIALTGNSQFYFPEAPTSYSINIDDTEDGNVLDVKKLMVYSDYIDSPDKAALPQGHQQKIVASGKTLMENSDCQSCHKMDTKSVGPAFTAVANRYQKTPANIDYLVKKIVNGGGGVWGETAMAAHPGLTKSDASFIAEWILGLGKESAEVSLPSKGLFAIPKELKDKGLLILSANYTDKGEKSQTGGSSIELRHPLLEGVDADQLSHCRKIDFEEQELIAFDEEQGFLAYKNIDLTNVKALELHYGIPSTLADNYIAEVRLDSPTGQLIANQPFGKNTVPVKTQLQRIPIAAVSDKKLHSVYLVLKKNNSSNGGLYLGKIGLKAR